MSDRIRHGASRYSTRKVSIEGSGVGLEMVRRVSGWQFLVGDGAKVGRGMTRVEGWRIEEHD